MILPNELSSPAKKKYLEDHILDLRVLQSTETAGQGRAAC